VLAYIDHPLIGTKGLLNKHHKQVSKGLQLLMDNQMCIEIDKCVFDVSQTPFLGFLVSCSQLCMDQERSKGNR